MKPYKKIVILLNLVLVVFLFNFSVWKKEKVLAEGNLVLLKLAPVDPRSLMQGDYMELRYDFGITEAMRTPVAKRGFCVIKTDANKVGRAVRFQTGPTPLREGEQLLRYHRSQFDIHLGAESYFFEEGTAESFNNARYGGLRVDDKGNSILVGLYDEQHRLIVPRKENRGSNTSNRQL